MILVFLKLSFNFKIAEISASPRFSTLHLERYVVLDQSAQICCNVTESNPPATQFRYLRGSEQLANDSNHVILVDAANQSSCLKVFKNSVKKNIRKLKIFQILNS